MFVWHQPDLLYFKINTLKKEKRLLTNNRIIKKDDPLGTRFLTMKQFDIVFVIMPVETIMIFLETRFLAMKTV